MNARIRMVLAGSAAVMLTALVATAQQKEGGSPLSGPSVKDREVPGTAPQFADGEQGKLKQRELPPRAFQEALMTAIGPDAPEDVRASEEVRGELRKLFTEFRGKMEAFAKDHRGEMEQFRKNRQQNGAPGGGKPAEEMTDADKAVRDAMPKASDVYAKVWTLLNDKQRAAVEAKIEEFKHEQDVRQGKEYVKRRLAKKGEPEGAPEPERATKKKISGDKLSEPDGAVDAKQAVGQGQLTPEFRERLIRLFARLSPEERERVLKRIEGLLADRGNESAPKNQARKNPEGEGIRKPKKP